MTRFSSLLACLSSDGCSFSLLASASVLLIQVCQSANRCDQHRRWFTGNKTTTLVEVLKPTGQLVSIKPPSSAAGLGRRVATWGEGLLQPLPMS